MIWEVIAGFITIIVMSLFAHITKSGLFVFIIGVTTYLILLLPYWVLFL